MLFFIDNFGNQQRDPEQTCCLLLNFMKNQRSVPIETSCAHPPSQSSDEFRVSLSWFLHLAYRLMILSSVWWSITGIWPPVERCCGEQGSWKTLGKLPTQLKEISLLSSKTLNDLGLSGKIGGWSDIFPQFGWLNKIYWDKVKILDIKFFTEKSDKIPPS